MTSRELLVRWADQVGKNLERDPSFWTSLKEELQRRGRIPEITSRDRGVQVCPDSDEVAIQSVVPTVSQGTQTQTLAEEVSSTTGGPTEAGPAASTRPTEASDPAPTGSGPGPSSRTSAKSAGCWNCHRRSHRMSECPRVRRRNFCYRCGRDGTTLPDCPTCGPAWHAEGRRDRTPERERNHRGAAASVRGRSRTGLN